MPRMPRDHRRADVPGRTEFSCSNTRFRTKTDKGEHHGESETRGSVFRTALVHAHSGCSLWLEHVEKIGAPEEQLYWLMWYDSTGMPAIPMSGVFGKEEIAEMSRQLAGFVP